MATERRDSGVMEVRLRSRPLMVEDCSRSSFRRFLRDSRADESWTTPTGQPRYGSNSKAMWHPASERRCSLGVQPVRRLKVRSER